jgi:hypothetical protein
VVGAHGVGVGVDEHRGRGEPADRVGPVVLRLDEVGRLADERREVLGARRDSRVELADRRLPDHVGRPGAHRVHGGDRVGVVAVAPERDRDEHQPAHPVRMLDRRAQSDHPAQRVAHDVGLLEAEVLDQCRHVVGHRLGPERSVDVRRVAVALELDGDHAPAGRKRRQHRRPQLGRAEAAVQQHERFAGAVLLVVQGQPVHVRVAHLVILAVLDTKLGRRPARELIGRPASAPRAGCTGAA